MPAVGLTCSMSSATLLTFDLSCCNYKPQVERHFLSVNLTT
jgi:hypothetical protein